MLSLYLTKWLNKYSGEYSTKEATGSPTSRIAGGVGGHLYRLAAAISGDSTSQNIGQFYIFKISPYLTKWLNMY